MLISSEPVTVTQYLIGSVYVVITAGALAVTGLECRRMLMPSWSGAVARLAESIVALSALVIVMELLGLFGLLTRAALLLAVIAVGLTSRVAARRPVSRGGSVAAPPRPVGPSWGMPLALLVATVAIAHWAGGVHDSLAHGIYRQDSDWYHLPFAAWFFQTGNTWAIHFTDPMALTAWFYPMNSELLHTAGMLAFGTDFPSPFVNVAWMALALLAAWCAGRPFGLGATTVVAAAVVLDSNMMQVQAGNAPSDVAGVFFLLAAAALLLNADAAARAGDRAVGPGPLLVAALAAGLAVGTKITMLAPVAVLAAGMVLLGGRAHRARSVAISAGGLLAVGGYWYARNLFHAGNPLPWISAGPLAGPDQLALYPRPPHSVADYATNVNVWTHEFGPDLGRMLSALWPLVLGGAAVGLVLALLRGPPIRRLLGAAGLAAAFTYVLIPVSASGSLAHPGGFESNLRYLAPAIALGLVLLALEAGRRRVLRRALPWGVGALFVFAAVTSPTWSADQTLTAVVLALALVALPAFAVLMGRAGKPAGPIAGIAAVGVVLIVLAGYPAQRQYLRDRYLPSLATPADNPGFRATPQWRRIQGWALGVRSARIGVVGPPAAFGQYVFYGQNLSNRVDYVGEPTSHAGYHPIDSCIAWRHAINRGAYEYVVVTPASAIGPGSVPQERLWMDGATGAQEILRAGSASIYRIKGQLDPHACAAKRLPPVIHVPGGGFAVPSIGLGPRPRSRHQPQ